MLQNYFKLAIRNIMKYKFFSAINILGMSIGITACLLIVLYVADFWGAPTVKYKDKIFTEEKIFLADSNFFSFFSFKILEGDPKTALIEPNTVVLTKSIATKYFGAENAIGKLITIRWR